jgi:hypothetical protein
MLAEDQLDLGLGDMTRVKLDGGTELEALIW